MYTLPKKKKKKEGECFRFSDMIYREEQLNAFQEANFDWFEYWVYILSRCLRDLNFPNIKIYR